MRGPLDLARELLQAEVAHEIVHLPRRIDDAGELPDVLGVPSDECVTVLLYAGDARTVAAFVPAGAVPATTAIARAAGTRRLRPLDAAGACAVTDCHPALVPPVGLPRDVRVVADTALADQDVVYTATGDGSTALKVHAADLLALTGARAAPLVEPGALPFEPGRAAELAWRDDRVPVPPPVG